MSHAIQNKGNRFAREYKKRGTSTGQIQPGVGFSGRTGGGVIVKPRGKYSRNEHGHIVWKGGRNV